MIMRHTSTYPEFPRKSLLRRYLENLYIYLRDGSPCAAYDGLGLDIKGRSLSDFVSNLRWLKFLNKELAAPKMSSGSSFQRLRGIGRSQVPLLQNKYLFWSFLQRHGIPAVPVVCHTIGGQVFQTAGEAPLEEMDRFFAKPADDNCGNLAFPVVVEGGRFFSGGREISKAELFRSDVDYIFQPVIVNHEGIRKFNPTTLNTLRLASCRTKSGNLELWDSGMIRIGRTNTTVDNFSQGGIGVGIDEDGKLKEYGYFHDHDECYGKSDCHPDSRIAFKGSPVPFYKEAVALVLKAHRLFPTIKTIGWDVAVTPEGPLLVEGNHDGGLEMLQIVHHKGSAARFREIYG